MAVIHNLLQRIGLQRIPKQIATLPGEDRRPSSEIGDRPTPENRIKYLYRQMWVDPDLRQAVLDIRDMDRLDGRVKKIHGRMARAAIKGGLQLRMRGTDRKLSRLWQQFERRLHLHRREKLESDCRALIMEGNLPMQWVLGPDNRVIAGIRMPSETIMPNVEANGRFKNPAMAYQQFDLTTGVEIARFALWQLSMVRLTPDSYDDHGSMGRPYLDASRGVWRKLVMTDEDLVIRRRVRAPLRLAHVLEGANTEDLDEYRAQVESDQDTITTDFYLNKKGSVSAIQGDANLDQIADVSYLLDTFFAGAPAPKGLFGYTDGLARDILEDLKRDYYDELDALQDTLSFVYHLGFRLDLLLQGINPDHYDVDVVFAERRTDTPNQRADLALKHQALGVPKKSVFESAGLDPVAIQQQLEDEAAGLDPYPESSANAAPSGRVSITPGNAHKGESATTISTRG